MSKICARCGAESRDEARMCVGCGGSNFKLASKLRRPPLVVPCPTCKRLNRPGTQLCVKCGTDLISAAAMTGPAPLPAAVPRSREPDAERQVAEAVELPDWVHAPASRPRSGILIAAIAVAGIVVAAAAWFAIGREAPEPDLELDADATAPPLADQPGTPAAAPSRSPGDAVQASGRPAPAPPGTAVGATPNAGESARARQAREKQEREARARTALEQQHAADQERLQAEAAGPQAAAAPPPPPVAAAAPPAAPAVPPQTVSQICGGRNPIAEQLCQLRECGNTGHAGDPVCIRFRELEESSNRRVDH
jgi:hypothetical protein